MSKIIYVIGGGAAGFFSAITAAENSPGSRVVILEKSPSVLAKVKISGGGRCNVTNFLDDPKELIKYYPRGGKQLLNILHRFGTKNTWEWFESRGVKLKAETDDRVFPVTDKSQTIIDCLVNEAHKNYVEILTQKNITDIIKTESGFAVQTAMECFNCDNLIITTGNSQRIWDVIASLGHEIVNPVPSLFTFNLIKETGGEEKRLPKETPGDSNENQQNNFYEVNGYQQENSQNIKSKPEKFSNEQRLKHEIISLAGVSVPEAEVKVKGTRLAETGPLLITHWGFSGPAVLKLSSIGAVQLYKMDYNFEIIIKWIPGFNHDTLREALLNLKKENASKHLNSFSPFDIPKRLWSFLLKISGVDEEKKWNDLSAAGLARLVEEILGGRYQISGKSTFKEEFVTAGGVNLGEVDLSTMESKKHKGLYFAGEVLNIDGLTGGFNFQSAWSTGYIAGISQKS